jgi:hypothetical protein
MTETALQKHFDLKRFLYLLRYELFSNYRTLIVILSTTVGIVFLTGVFSAAAAPHFHVYRILYPSLVLMAGGLIFSSLAFKETHEPGNDLRYLTLPCSRLEKTLAKFILTTLGYLVLSAIVTFIISLAAMPFALLLFGQTHGVFNPFTDSVLDTMGVYLIVQAVFVFGSIYFKKAAFAKTILSLMALALTLALFAGLVFTLTHIDLIVRGAFTDWRYLGGPFDARTFLDFWKYAPGIVFKVLVAPFFWVLTFIRLGEQEVRSV